METINREYNSHVILTDADKAFGSVLNAALDADALFEVHKKGIALPNGYVPLVPEGTYEGEPVSNQTYREFPLGSAAPGARPKQARLAMDVSPGYPTSNYSQLIQMADALFPGSCSMFKMFGQGQRVMFTQELDEEVDLGGGDVIKASLLWMASLNTSWSTQVHGIAGRFFCTNQISMSDTYIKVKRTKNHDLRLLERGAVLALAMDQFSQFVEQAKVLREVQVSSADCWKVLHRMVPPPQPAKGKDEVSGLAQGNYDRKIAGIRYFWAEEQSGPSAGTAWALYNAFQSYEYHTETKGKADRKVDVVRKHQPFTQQALETIQELVMV